MPMTCTEAGASVVPGVGARPSTGQVLEAIASARETITFETYIYWEGKVGERHAAMTVDGVSVVAVDSTEPDLDRSALDGLLDLLGRTLEPVYGFRSLLAFKAKFQPESWEPVYAVLPARGLPRTPLTRRSSAGSK